MNNILIGDIKTNLKNLLEKINSDKIFILMDINTKKYCYPIIKELNNKWFEIPPIMYGDINKNFNQVYTILKYLSDNNASRNSLIINLGGGVITDIGGFCASIYKRGIKFINIPTTLLSMVDASYGGKTGINFNGLKNEIGTFTNADYILIDKIFLNTLNKENILSAFGEIIKYSLLKSDKVFNRYIEYNLNNFDGIEEIIKESLNIKKEIIEKDFNESGLRKCLNLGHTIGHAYEALNIQKGNYILHGYAVIYGLLCELYLSNMIYKLPIKYFDKLLNYVKDNYELPILTYKYYNNDIYNLILHDKKNIDNKINCILLENIGKYKITEIRKDDIFTTLNYINFKLTEQ